MAISGSISDQRADFAIQITRSATNNLARRLLVIVVEPLRLLEAARTPPDHRSGARTRLLQTMAIMSVDIRPEAALCARQLQYQSARWSLHGAPLLRIGGSNWSSFQDSKLLPFRLAVGVGLFLPT